MSATPTKICVVCGREMTWRRKWANNWDQVRYCSDACRRQGISDTDRMLERAILELLANRSAEKTICPSEAAKRVGGEQWRALNEPVRRAARRLVAEGKILICQQGKPVDPSRARGAIRLKKV